MATLRVSHLLGQTILILDDESLAVLEQGASRDRVTRIFYESVESIIIWRDSLWGRKTLVTLIFGYICLAPLWTDFTSGRNSDMERFFLTLALLSPLELYILARDKYHLRINHGGQAFNVSATAFSRTIRKFAEKIRARAEETQGKLRAKRETALAEKREG